MKTLAAFATALLCLFAWPALAQDATASRADARFLKKAAAHGAAEVELARLAQQKGLRDEVKQFADRMVADHGKANEEIAALASKKGVQLLAEPDRKHRRALERLQKLVGPDFDRAFMRHMVKEHREALGDFRKRAKNAKDPDIKAFAEKTAPILHDHLQAARATRDAVAGSKRTGKRETGSTRS